jgi:hypothetical protein
MIIVALKKLINSNLCLDRNILTNLRPDLIHRRPVIGGHLRLMGDALLHPFDLIIRAVRLRVLR